MRPNRAKDSPSSAMTAEHFLTGHSLFRPRLYRKISKFQRRILRQAKSHSRWRRGGALKRFDLNIAELNRVIMASETEVTFSAVFAGMFGAVHEFVNFGQIAIEDDGSVQLDFNF